MTLPVGPEDRAELVDAEALRDLARQVGVGAAADFAARYLEALPARLARLRAAALSRDSDGCLAAALSLRSSSAMVGAQPLAEAAEEYVVAARSGRWPSLRTLLRLCKIGQATATALGPPQPLHALPTAAGGAGDDGAGPRGGTDGCGGSAQPAELSR